MAASHKMMGHGVCCPWGSVWRIIPGRCKLFWAIQPVESGCTAQNGRAMTMQERRDGDERHSGRGPDFPAAFTCPINTYRGLTALPELGDTRSTLLKNLTRYHPSWHLHIWRPTKARGQKVSAGEGRDKELSGRIMSADGRGGGGSPRACGPASPSLTD